MRRKPLISLTPEQLENLRKVQIKLLDAFVKICDENNLIYFLVGGTALGAVRHKGYIPWDDDIDVGMPREDYERFRELAPTLLPQDMIYQSVETEPICPRYFAKIRHLNSLQLYRSSKHLKINHGIYIDIFPIDGGSNCYETAKKHMMKMLRHKQLIGLEFYRKTTLMNPIRREALYFAAKFYKMLISRKRMIKRANKLLTKYSFQDSDYVQCLLGSYKEKEVVKKEVYVGPNGATGTAMFCGKKYKVPNDVHAYLASIFGDYMTLPPEEKRISHHDMERLEFPDSAELKNDDG
jgi:lipopolysaccharide cholinephosphotransferase